MTMVVSLGLSRFAYEDRESVVGMLEAIVASGHTELVREVVTTGMRDALETARVCEVSASAGGPKVRWLEEAERAPLLPELAELYEENDTYASFSWDELDDLPAYDVQDLAFTFDRPAHDRVQIALQPDLELWAIDLDQSADNWTDPGDQSVIASRFTRSRRSTG